MQRFTKKDEEKRSEVKKSEKRRREVEKNTVSLKTFGIQSKETTKDTANRNQSFLYEFLGQ